jgi:cobalt-zinc-cadmium resistance protein CzcA
MIRRLIDFALQNRLLILGASLVLFGWGIFSFHALPIEAYPDVADTYAQVITQWPGHAAEEVEQQITVPLEVELNGVAHLTHLRSVSLMGLSVITIIYDDDITTFNARQEVLDRLLLVTLPNGVNPAIGPDYSPTGQIMFYTLTSSNPKYDAMELKALNDWVVVNQLKSVPNIVDVNPFGGPTREYQVQLDPGKLVAYGLSLSQVETALAANNINAGGGFIERGEQALNVRAVGLMQSTDDIAATVVKVQNGTPVRVRDLGNVVQAPKVRLGQLGKTIRNKDGSIVNNDDVVEGIVLLRKGAVAETTLDALHQKINELNGKNGKAGLLPQGVKLVSHLDRSELMHHTTHTVLRNLTDGVLLVTLILFLFLGNVRSALIVAITIPFSLLFAAILLDLRHIPANLLSLGALDFGMVVDGRRNGRKHPSSHLVRQHQENIHGDDCHRGPRSTAPGLFRARHHYCLVPSDFHATARRGTAVQPDGVDRRLRPPGRVGVCSAHRTRFVQHAVQFGNQGMAKPGPGVAEPQLRPHTRLVFRSSEADLEHRAAWPRDHAVHRFQRNYWVGVSASPRRRRDLGARDFGAQHRTFRQH